MGQQHVRHRQSSPTLSKCPAWAALTQTMKLISNDSNRFQTGAATRGAPTGRSQRVWSKEEPTACCTNRRG
eukprot:265847-Chlamydomonas_euryale.AAC.2